MTSPQKIQETTIEKSTKMTTTVVYNPPLPPPTNNNSLWGRRDIEQLLNLVSRFGVHQWKMISMNMTCSLKSELDCQEFYSFLMNCANKMVEGSRNKTTTNTNTTTTTSPNNNNNNVSKISVELPPEMNNSYKPCDILSNKPIRDKKKKRYRRKASQIERLYKCQEKYCNRAYGTEGALKMHIKLKHPSVKYDSKYQLQAKYAALMNKNKKNEDDNDDLDDDDDFEEVDDSEDFEESMTLTPPKVPPTNDSLVYKNESVLVTPSPIRNYVYGDTNSFTSSLISVPQTTSFNQTQIFTPLPIAKRTTTTTTTTTPTTGGNFSTGNSEQQPIVVKDTTGKSNIMSVKSLID